VLLESMLQECMEEPFYITGMLNVDYRNGLEISTTENPRVCSYNLLQSEQGLPTMHSILSMTMYTGHQLHAEYLQI